MGDEPFIIAALTITVPAETVLRVFPDIVAPVVPAFWTLHVIVLFVAFDGLTVPVNINGVPAVAADETPVIFVTGTKGSITLVTVI